MKVKPAIKATLFVLSAIVAAVLFAGWIIYWHENNNMLLAMAPIGVMIAIALCGLLYAAWMYAYELYKNK